MQKRWIVATIMLTGIHGIDAQEAGPADAPTRLPTLIVEEGKIFEGKKVTVTDLQEIPPVVNNDWRQAFTQKPGLLVSEQGVPSFVNLNYRGLGDPHESEFVMTLRDGIPIIFDWFGYPSVYYTPPLESIERIEFIRGGSALLYGPQPGPVLNYITHLPSRDREFTVDTRHTLGSDNFYSTFNQFGGTVDNFGYLGWFHHRQGDGQRDANSDFDVFAGEIKLVLDETDDSRWTVVFDGYESESGEAGRLTYEQFKANRNQTVRPNDRMWIERYAFSVANERALGEDTALSVKGWGAHTDRFSRRRSGDFFNLDDRSFFYSGLDTRAQHDWPAWGDDHTLTAGLLAYGAYAPRYRERTTDPNATVGTTRFQIDQDTIYGALFAENRFGFGRFGFIPATRLELVRMRVDENVNFGLDDDNNPRTPPTRELIRDTFTAVVPLVGVGLTFDLDQNNELYSNVSQGYRPPKHDDLANPTAVAQLVSPHIEEGHTWNYELGVRGSPAAWLSYDASLFQTDFDGMMEDHYLGGGNRDRRNSGTARYQGVEASAEVELLSLADALAHHAPHQHNHQVSLFANASLLGAEFTEGGNEGNTPAYAPDHIVKTGVIYRWRDRVKVALTGTMVDAHFWQDTNLPGDLGISQIPAYAVWDLTAEANVIRNRATIFAGINNVADEKYFSRVRGEAIEPALGRNFHGGFKLTF